MDINTLKALIETGLPEAEVLVEGDGAHFSAVVISNLFAGKSRLEKQKIVYNTVQTQLADGTLHALSVKTFTPEEWNNLNQ